jgi:endonuclease/exonuclease/phosphatase family metal-dependent hydrolase
MQRHTRPAGALAAVLLAACAHPPPAALAPPSVTAIRIGTLNAKLIPFTGTEARAETLAARILAADLDVVALQEVFSEAARADLRQALGAAYPWSVDRLGSARLLRADAGLMLLSRLPFEPLPDSVPGAPAALEARVAGRPTSEAPVRFLEYGACARVDCRVAKGAGYVRLRVAGRPLHLFFTHMQAPYGSDPPDGERETAGVRSRQRRELAAFVRGAVGPERLARENVLLVGDFNVDGSADLTGGLPRRTEILGDERSRMMGELGAVFPRGLVDLWRASRPGEAGLTFPVRALATRFDYVLASLPDPAADLCVTRIRRAFGLDPRIPTASADIERERDLTDHVGLVVGLAARPGAPCIDPEGAGSDP